MARREYLTSTADACIGDDLSKVVVLEGLYLLIGASRVSGHEEAVDHIKVLSRALGVPAGNRAWALEKGWVEQWDKGLRS
jgi:hypothetical protein